MNSPFLLLLASISFIAAACDDGDFKTFPDASGNPDASSDNSDTSELAGTQWHGPCSSANVIKLSFGASTPDSAVTIELYEESDCSNQAMGKLQTSFTRTVDDSQSPRWLDTKATAHTMTMLTDTGVAIANNEQIGGFDDWQKGVSKDLLGIDLRTDIFSVDDGDEWLGIYRIENDWIYWALDIDGTTRPTTFTNVITAKKQ